MNVCIDIHIKERIVLWWPWKHHASGRVKENIWVMCGSEICFTCSITHHAHATRIMCIYVYHYICIMHVVMVKGHLKLCIDCHCMQPWRLCTLLIVINIATLPTYCTSLCPCTFSTEGRLYYRCFLSQRPACRVSTALYIHAQYAHIVCTIHW